jgi:YVTN family beta-propeller protein
MKQTGPRLDPMPPSHRLVCAGLASLGLLSGCSGAVASHGAADGGGEAGYSAPAGTIFVTMYGDNEITVFDEATLAVTGHIPLGELDGGQEPGPAVMVATPDNKKLYTANWSGNTISVVDVATSTVTSTIALDGRPWAIAMSPVGHTLFAGVSSNKLVAIDTTMDLVSASYDTSPDFPESVIVSADGSQVYIDPTSTSASITDLTSGTLESLSATDGGGVQQPIAVGGTPAFLSISPDGTRAYTLNFIPGTMSVIDTTTWTVVATVDTGSQPIISSSTPNNQLVVVTDFGASKLVTVDFQTNKILSTITLTGRPVGVGGYSPAGTVGYVVDFGPLSLGTESLSESLSFLNGDLSPFVQGQGTLTAFNPQTGQVLGSPITVGHGPTSIVVIPN